MAKRKRLELPTEAETAELETKSAFSGMSRMPIAEVVGDTSARAALDAVSREMTQAESEGRIVRKLVIDQIDARHLSRDRMVLDAEEMSALKASIAARGQQTPIEVLALPSGRFGLISGLRRLEALRALGATDVLAFVRTPEGAAASYVAMVEENEIRAGLSFYERANIVVQAVGAGVYPNPQRAVKALFGNVASAKRSKILRFVLLRQTLGKSLRFPTAIPEKLGLALANAIEAEPKLAAQISARLRNNRPGDAAAERRVLDEALKPPASGTAAGDEVASGVMLKTAGGRVTLSGPGVDQDLVRALRAWLKTR